MVLSNSCVVQGLFDYIVRCIDLLFLLIGGLMRYLFIDFGAHFVYVTELGYPNIVGVDIGLKQTEDTIDKKSREEYREKDNEP